ncbi:hypothetical protein T484DRAFT_2022903, partial [Baffinella frigidus]
MARLSAALLLWATVILPSSLVRSLPSDRGMYEPGHGGRGGFRPGYVDRGRGGFGRDGGDQRGSAMVQREDWEEERKISNALAETVVKKVSMKRWIEERHGLWPSRTSIERQMVEANEDARMLKLEHNGWPGAESLAKFRRANRTCWEETALKQKVEKSKSLVPRHILEYWPLVEEGRNGPVHVDLRPGSMSRGGALELPGPGGILREAGAMEMRGGREGDWSREDGESRGRGREGDSEESDESRSSEGSRSDDSERSEYETESRECERDSGLESESERDSESRSASESRSDSASRYDSESRETERDLAMRRQAERDDAERDEDMRCMAEMGEPWPIVAGQSQRDDDMRRLADRGKALRQARATLRETQTLGAAAKPRAAPAPAGGGVAPRSKAKEEYRYMVRPWRKLIDRLFGVCFQSPDDRWWRFSLSGLVVDSVLASQLLNLAQILIDVAVAIPVLKLFSNYAIPVVMPWLSDFPHLAHLSVQVAHWGIRLAKSALAAALAAGMVSFLHHRGVAFQNPLLAVMYACISNLFGTWRFLQRLSQDEKYKDLVSIWGLALRVVSCEVPSLMIFIYATMHSCMGYREEVIVAEILGVVRASGPEGEEVAPRLHAPA